MAQVHWRVQVRAVLNSAASFNEFKDDVELEISGKDEFDRPVNHVFDGQELSYDFHLRLNKEADARAIWNRFNNTGVQNKMRTNATEVQVSIHLCPHADPILVYSCKDDAQAAYEEIIF